MKDNEIEETPQEIPQVSFNLIESMRMEIAQLLQNSSIYFSSRKYAESFDCLKAIQMRIVNFLTKEEKEKLNDIEKSKRYYIIKERLRNEEELVEMEPALRNLAENALKKLKIKGNLRELIERYNDLIMSMLDKYGFFKPEGE